MGTQGAIIARIILLPDGKVHIALRNFQTCVCNYQSFQDLVRDPYAFIESGYKQHPASTRHVNNPRKELEDIKGMTLAEISESAELTVISPLIWEHVSKKHKDNQGIDLSDIADIEKCQTPTELLIKFYLLLGKLSPMYSVENMVSVPQERLTMLLKEMLNTFSCVAKKEPLYDSVSATSDISEAPLDDKLLFAKEKGKKMVTVTEYADYVGFSRQTVIAWIKKSKLTSAVQKKNGWWYVDIHEPVPEPRHKGRCFPVKSDGRKHFRKKGDSYEDVQKIIEERKLVTKAIRPFIRDYNEAKYYEKRNYREVEINGEHAMIVDICPEYYCSRLGKTNRELILEGKAPVVPNEDQNDLEGNFPVPLYHLHHIGQKKDSPFAIIPASIHNSQEMYSTFHPSSLQEKLHDVEFEIRKKSFWRGLLNAYDEYGEYKKIPYFNSKHKKDMRE